MAGMINMDPAKGLEVAEMLTKLCDGEMLTIAQSMYNAIRALGDDNNIVVQFGERMNSFQNAYNSDCVDSFNSLKAGMEKFTDVATYVSKVAVETGVSMGETQRADVEAQNMDALAGW